MSTNQEKQNYSFVIMGVSGSGKSAVASGVSREIEAAFLDGDFLHPRSNIEKMGSGHALNDDDRKPWLEALNDAIFAMQRTNNVSLVVCSALKKQYRDILRKGNKNLYFIYLHGEFDLIESRLKSRKGHFFKPEMLVSQFNTLEQPSADETDVYAIDISKPLDGVIADTKNLIAKLALGEK